MGTPRRGLNVVSAMVPRIHAPVAPSDLRRVLGSFATGVVVVAGEDDDGPVGFSCQSFASVSLEPPLVLFCPAHTSASWLRIAATGRFVVNVLAADQREMCARFATSGVDKFAGMDWAGTAWGPAIEDVLAQVMCTVQDVHAAGDHDIVVGHVQQLVTPREDGPLLFFRGEYGLNAG
jgi:3-hydroxy-9,10-secoandrosta-1,3,5(10)-triene-9,17-dione monooxygenase reductase component